MQMLLDEARVGDDLSRSRHPVLEKRQKTILF